MNLQAMIDSLECAVLLAGRYADLAREQLASADAERRPQLELIIETLERAAKAMAEAANGATAALSNQRVPFLGTFMGGAETGYDMRDTANQATSYNGSGCLIHGLSVVADSFVAIDQLLKERPEDCERLLRALGNDFADDPELREYLRAPSSATTFRSPTGSRRKSQNACPTWSPPCAIIGAIHSALTGAVRARICPTATGWARCQMDERAVRCWAMASIRCLATPTRDWIPIPRACDG